MFCLFVSLTVLVLEGVDNRYTVGHRSAMDVVFALMWAVLALDSGIRLFRVTREKGFSCYWKFNKADFLYLILSSAALTAAFLLPAYAWCRWILLLKMPRVLSGYNDENVFQIIAKSAALILTAVFVVPMLNVVATALSAPGQIVNVLPKRFDLFSVRFALADIQFLKSFGYSLFIVAVGTTLFLLIMATAAYPLSKPDLPGKKWIMLFYMFTMYFTGGMATDIVLMDSLGLMNTIWALILPSVVSIYYMLLIKSSYESLPSELEEAAKIDGASQIYVFTKIVLPLSKPILATTASFMVVGLWNNYMNSVMYITYNQEIYPVQMYIRNFMARNPFDVAMDNPALLSYWDNLEMAYLALAILPIICAYPLLFRFFKNGVTAGAVKG